MIYFNPTFYVGILLRELFRIFFCFNILIKKFNTYLDKY